MAGKQTLTYPSDEDILEGIREHRGLNQYARALGISGGTLRHHVTKRELLERIQEIRTSRPQLQPSKAPQADDDVSREEILEQENRELRAAAKRDRKGDVHKERLVRGIEEALAVVPPPKRVPGAKLKSARSGGAHHRQLTAWSDWHGGEMVDPEAVNGLNEYSWAIMEARVDELVEGLLSHQRRSPDLTGLDIALVGDMVSGNVHRELAETNEYPLAVQGVKMGHLLGRTIERLVPHYETIKVVSVVGNHPRLQMKPAAKNVHDNIDWVAAQIAKEYLSKYPTVSVAVPASDAAFHTIAGKTFYIWHSDGVRSSMPGIPWGGIMRRVNEIRRSYAGRTIDYFLCGHWHQANLMVDLGIFMNGSLKGCDEWVLKTFGGGSMPTQLLLTFDERRGRLTDARFLNPVAGIPVAEAAA